MRVTADVVGIVEDDSFGRRMHARPHRFVAMTHAAAGEDRIVCRLDVEPICAWTDVRGSRARQPCHGHHPGGRHAPRPPRAAFALVPGIEEVADDGTDGQHDRDDQPVETGREHQRVMVGDHQEDDGQREVVVMDGALLGLFAPRRIGRFAGEQRRDGLLLVRDDDEEHVRHHDGADQRADLGKRAAAAEHVGKAICERDEKEVAHQRERNLVPAERGPAQRLVDEPGEHETCERDGCGGRCRQVEHGFVDEIEFRAEIVDDHQQREAGEPGGIGFPLEPGQLIRHASGGDEILHHMVEATAVDLPGVTLDTRRQTRSRLETEIEMDEIK